MMKIKPIIFTLLLFFIILSASCSALTAGEPEPSTPSEALTVSAAAEYIKITSHEARDMMVDGVIILDVRSYDEFNNLRIINAVSLPHDQIKEEAENIIPDKSVTILVYCQSGIRSEIAARKLIDLGYTNVFDFGGIRYWDYEIIS